MAKTEEESEKVGLELNIQQTKITATGPITSWQIDGKTMETVADFIFLGSKVIVDGDCSHEIKRHWLLEREAVTNPVRLLNSRDVTRPTEVCMHSQSYAFPSVRHEHEGWAIKKAGDQRTDAFELWCWRSLRVPWTAGRSNQSILKEVNPECSLEALMLKVKLQYFGPLL